jgi:hypothetical protein
LFFIYPTSFTHSKICLPNPFLFSAIPAINNDREAKRERKYTIPKKTNFLLTLQDKTRDCSDITARGPLPNGAQSAKVEGKDNWLVYGGKNEADPSAELVAGKAYPNVESMGLPAGTIIQSIKIKA